MKLPEVTERPGIEIKQISAVIEPEQSDKIAKIYGLGTDGRVYKWSTKHEKWHIHK